MAITSNSALSFIRMAYCTSVSWLWQNLCDEPEKDQDSSDVQPIQGERTPLLAIEDPRLRRRGPFLKQ